MALDSTSTGTVGEQSNMPGGGDGAMQIVP
jgi:hypothetical protein